MSHSNVHQLFGYEARSDVTRSTFGNQEKLKNPSQIHSNDDTVAFECLEEIKEAKENSSGCISAHLDTREKLRTAYPNINEANPNIALHIYENLF